VAVLELVPVLEAVLEDDEVPVCDGVFDWDAEVDPVMVLTIEGATDEATTDEAATDPLDGATDEALPATDGATDEALTPADEALTLAATVLPATLVRLRLAAMVPLNVIDRENVELVHCNLIILLLLKSATNKKTPGKSGS